jgi:uridine phosphorylase
LLPEDVAGTVITVGDPDRVTEVSKYFDYIELKKSKREFVTHTGTIGNKRLTIL